MNNFVINKKKNRVIKEIAVFLCIMALLVLEIPVKNTMASVVAGAENIIVVNAEGQEINVRSLLVTTANERFLSLSDMSVVLKGTSKAYTVQISGNDADISLSSSTDRSQTEGYAKEDMQDLRRINGSGGKISINGSESAYAGIIDDLGGSKDMFMRMSDFVMVTDTNMYYDGVWHVDTENGFRVSKDELMSENFFDGVDAALIGDVTTGEIFFEYDGDVKIEIASTTKLISYAVIKDAIDAGEIRDNDMVTISKRAADLSKSEDGIVEYNAGDQIPVEELLIAMLLPSSNESSLAMAEHICGSEELFVQRMRDKLEELGAKDVEIYDCHGLPIYSNSAIASKRQNRMSAEDMFRVVCYIFENYPEVTDITSMKTADLPVAGAFVKNTNGLLKNMPEVNGLKTGTTNKAGACLIATCNALNDNGEEHTLAAMVFGAENNTARVSYAEVLMRLAKQEYADGSGSGSGSSVITFNDTPDVKKLLSEVMKTARKQGLFDMR